jgi:hypothetical protein
MDGWEKRMLAGWVLFCLFYSLCLHLVWVEDEVGERVGEGGQAGYLGLLLVVMVVV